MNFCFDKEETNVTFCDAHLLGLFSNVKNTMGLFRLSAWSSSRLQFALASYSDDLLDSNHNHNHTIATTITTQHVHRIH